MKKIIAFLMVATTAWALTTPPTSKEAAYLKHSNKIVNPGAENGTAKVLVSAGTLTATTLTAEVGLGARSFKWCPAAAGNTLSMSYYVVEGALKGQNGEASMLAQTSGTDFSLRVFDGSNQLATASTLTPSSSYQAWSQNFIFPSSGSLTINAIAGNPSNCIFLDDAYLGRPSNIGTVEQAQFVGSAYFAQTANCSWPRTNTAVGAFGTDADCPAPTIDKQVIGSWQTTDADLPRITINNLPPGIYKVTATGSMYGAGKWTMAISDGTNTRGYASGGGNASSTFQPANVSTAWFEYTDTGNRTFEIYGSSSSGAISLDNLNSNDRTTFVVERYPLQSQMLLGADQGDFGWVSGGTMVLSATTTPPSPGTATKAVDQVWLAKVGDTAKVRIEYRQTAAGTASAGSGDYLWKVPNNLLIDTTKVTAYSTVEGWNNTFQNNNAVGTCHGGNGSNQFFGRVVVYDSQYVRCAAEDGSSNAQGFIGSAGFPQSGGSQYYIFDFEVPIQGWRTSMRAPALINSVISSYEGTARIVSARLSSACAVSEEDGDWIASTTDNGTGDCTITINNGIFSQPPKCQFEVEATNAAINSGQTKLSTTTTPSATTIRYTTANSAGTLSDQAVNVICMGPK